VWQVALGDDMPLNSPKHPLYWNSTSGFDFDHISAVQPTCHSAPVSEIVPPSAENDVRSILKIKDLSHLGF